MNLTVYNVILERYTIHDTAEYSLVKVYDDGRSDEFMTGGRMAIHKIFEEFAKGEDIQITYALEKTLKRSIETGQSEKFNWCSYRGWLYRLIRVFKPQRANLWLMVRVTKLYK